MKSYLLKILDVRYGEGTRVALLLVMGFCMGMFIATITVASQALFLQKLDEETDLPIAFLISGAIGLIATIVYNFLQNRISFTFLASLFLLSVIGLTAFLEFGDGFFSDVRVQYYIGFALIIPFSFVVYLIFWGSFGRLFNTRQSKRLLGLVDTGAMVAAFIAYFSIPQILKLTETTFLYSISLVSITVFFLLFLYLSSRYLNAVRSFAQEKKYYKKLGLKDFLGNRYIVYMSLFVIVSMLVMNFVDYSFLSVTTQLFTEKNLANFISYFEMTVVIFNFLFQTFATDRIVNEYGMRVAMLINPVLIGLFTASAVIVGRIFGYSPDDNLFIVFFISIAMCKLFMSSLKDALDNQTFRLYLLPIESHVRIDVQTKIEGMVTAFATLMAGGLIIVITKVQIFDLWYLSIFTLPLVVAWYFISTRMHKGYRHTLQATLSTGKQNANKQSDKGFTTIDVLEKGINSDTEDKVVYALRLMEKLEPALFENTLIRLSKSESKKIKRFAEEKMQSLGVDADLIKNEVRKLATQAAIQTNDSDLISISPEKLLKLSKSVRHDDRILAAKLISQTLNAKTIFILLELLRDAHPSVRYEALYTARKVKRAETWPVLIEMLGSPSFSHHAAAALKECGESVLPTLDAAFHRSGQSDVVMLRIVQIIGRIGGNYALKLLWRKADYPDKRIVKQIFYSLRYINYHAAGREAREVINLLEVEMGKTLWNMTALHELPKEDSFNFLRGALREEIADNFDQIVMLLSILYDPQSVQLVQENINTGSPDNIAFALELLDLFVDADLKPKLFPLFDDSPIEEKLRNLQLYYPRESYNPIQVVNYILNRDFNLNNRWTKACAIHASAFIKDFRISRGLIAQVFNSDKLLQETAAWVIYNKDRRAYESIAERLPVRDKKYLDSSIENNQLLNGLEDGFFLNVEMIMVIKQLPAFRNIHGLYVSDLADRITPIDLERGQIASLRSEAHNAPVFIVAHGSARFHMEDGTTRELNRYGILGDLFKEEHMFAQQIEALERCVVFKINLMDFYFVMANHHELVEGLIKNLSSGERSVYAPES